MTPITAEPGVVELDRAEGRALVERQARKLLGMSLEEEFIRGYDSGELDVDTPGVLEVALLLPFVR